MMKHKKTAFIFATAAIAIASFSASAQSKASNWANGQKSIMQS